MLWVNERRANPIQIRENSSALILQIAVAILTSLPLMLRAADQPVATATNASEVSNAETYDLWIATEIAEEKIRFINDEELFALFPDRPMALIGEPGQQQLVFLDNRPANAVSPN